MKAIKCDLPVELDEIELFPLADMHIGEKQCDMQHIKEIIEYIKESPKAYFIMGGDFLNTAIRTGISDIYSETMSPMEELKRCVELFEPIKHKCLAIVHGNHENRIYKNDGIDTTAIMATQLGLADRYSETTALLFIRLGEETHHRRKVSYSVYLTHGSGGGRREGGKINRLVDLSTIVDADIYICGHTHLPAVLKESFYRCDYRNSAVSCVTKTFVNTSAALDYGGYGDVQGYKPASKDVPVIKLNGHKKKVKVSL